MKEGRRERGGGEGREMEEKGGGGKGEMRGKEARDRRGESRTGWG